MKLTLKGITYDVEKLDGHVRKVNGLEVPSVTTLLRKHGLGADYAGIPEAILEKAAKKGTAVHAEIEEYFKSEGEETPWSVEANLAIDFIEGRKFEEVHLEQDVCNDVTFGTLDFNGTRKNEQGQYERWLIDFKTTASKHEESWRWQVSLYAYLSGEHFDKLGVLWLTPGGAPFIELEPVKDEEIEKLLEAERDGFLYEKKETAAYMVPTDVQQKMLALTREIAALEEQKATAEENLSIIKEALALNMIAHKAKSFESADIKITLVQKEPKVGVDVKKLGEKYPEITEECVKTVVDEGAIMLRYPNEAKEFETVKEIKPYILVTDRLAKKKGKKA